MNVNRTPKASDRRPSVFSRVTEVGTPHASEHDPGYEVSKEKSTEQDHSFEIAGRKRSSISKALLIGGDYIPSTGRLTPKIQQISLNGTPKKQEIPETTTEGRPIARNQPRQLSNPKDRQQGSLPVIYSANIMPTDDLTSLTKFGKNAGSLSNKTLNNPDLFSLQNAGRHSSNHDFSSKKTTSQENADPIYPGTATPDHQSHPETRSIPPKVLNQVLTPIKAFRPLSISTRNTPRESVCFDNPLSLGHTKSSFQQRGGSNTARGVLNIEIPGISNIQQKVRKLLKKEMAKQPAVTLTERAPKKKEEPVVSKDVYLFKMAQQVRENLKYTKIPKVKKVKNQESLLKGRTVFSEILRPGALTARSQSTAQLTPLNSLYNVFPHSPDNLSPAPKSSRRDRSFERVLPVGVGKVENDGVGEGEKKKMKKRKKKVTKSRDGRVKNISTSEMTGLYLPRIRNGVSQDSRV